MEQQKFSYKPEHAGIIVGKDESNRNERIVAYAVRHGLQSDPDEPDYLNPETATRYFCSCEGYQWGNDPNGNWGLFPVESKPPTVEPTVESKPLSS